MHELSLMNNLLTDAIAAANGAPLRALKVRVGPLSGVVIESLQFAFDALTPGTPAEGARLDIEETAPLFIAPTAKPPIQRPWAITNVPPASPPMANCAAAAN